MIKARTGIDAEGAASKSEKIKEREGSKKQSTDLEPCSDLKLTLSFYLDYAAVRLMSTISLQTLSVSINVVRLQTIHLCVVIEV